MSTSQHTVISEVSFDGMRAWRMTSDSGATALVAARGATLISWQPYPGVDVIDGHINAQELSTADASRSIVAVPFIGRIKHGEYRFNGADYHITGLDGKQALHGLVFDQDFVAEDVTDTLTLRCDFPGCEGYPWAFTVRVTFSLNTGADEVEHLSVTIDATNKDKVTIPLAIGWHPYVKFPGHKTISNYSLTIPARTRIVYGPDLVPLMGEYAYSGVKAPVEIEYLGQQEMDESYRGLIPNDEGVVVTTVSDVSSNSRIELTQEPAESPVVHLFTGDTINRNRRGALALEPLSHLPDAFNRADSVASVALEPGHTRSLTATLTYLR